MLGGARDMLGRLQIQRAAVVEKCLNVFVRVFADADARRSGLLNDAIVHVGEVHHLNDAKPLRLQIPPQHVLKHKRAEISDVRKIVDRGPARVDAHLAGNQRNKRLRLPAYRVVKLDFRHLGSVTALSVGCALMANAPF